MSLLKRLGFARSDPAPAVQNRLSAAIARQLQGLSPQRAEFVAAFAGLLARVAYSDLEVSKEERATLPRLIADHAGISPTESEAVAEIVTRQATALAGIEYALLTRSFNEVASKAEKEQLVDCLFAIATTDDRVSLVEDETIRTVARALLLSHKQFIDIRQRYKDHLEVLQAARKLRRR